MREYLESSKLFDIDLFAKLLTRPDTDHIFLQETTDLIHSFALDYPEFITVDSIGKSW